MVFIRRRVLRDGHLFTHNHGKDFRKRFGDISGDDEFQFMSDMHDGPWRRAHRNSFEVHTCENGLRHRFLGDGIYISDRFDSRSITNRQHRFCYVFIVRYKYHGGKFRAQRMYIYFADVIFSSRCARQISWNFSSVGQSGGSGRHVYVSTIIRKFRAEWCACCTGFRLRHGG